jgi:predicted CoA-substrate-specific enzyme activase
VTTGSGRYLAARFIQADAARNEITAQLRSTLQYFPDVDTIFEIGGQDSKYISVKDGTISDFAMNKICAAGTGSFLEEQAVSLGLDIIQEFEEKALQSKTPVDLGSRCTVFMDTELVHALQRGAGLEDVVAGLAYSVAQNYLDKVVANKPVGGGGGFFTDSRKRNTHPSLQPAFRSHWCRTHRKRDVRQGSFSNRLFRL